MKAGPVILGLAMGAVLLAAVWLSQFVLRDSTPSVVPAPQPVADRGQTPTPKPGPGAPTLADAAERMAIQETRMAGTSRLEIASTTSTNATPAPAAAAAKKSGKPPIQDPIARVALAFVGEDPYAETYWMEAINDPSLSTVERQDLIEDLNEDGFADPHHPTIDDLPLILNRLALIEQLAPDAMDQVNADAFAEAYKDLANLAEVALGGGARVQ